MAEEPTPPLDRDLDERSVDDSAPLVTVDDPTVPEPHVDPRAADGLNGGSEESAADPERAGRPWRNLLQTTVGTAACAALGSVATKPGSRWYDDLDLPSWQPPKAAFPIVWTGLYVDIAATSAAVLTRLEREGRFEEATAYRRELAANLTLNTAWSGLFWRARNPLAAAVDAALLTVSSARLTRRAARTAPAMGAALAPYVAWCAFATALSAEIARRNR